MKFWRRKEDICYIWEAVSGVLLLWVRDYSSKLLKIPKSVIREICGYFDTRKIADVWNGTLYFYHLESQLWKRFPLSFETKKRPPLLVWGGAVYVFNCGPERNIHTGICTYQLTYTGKETRLGDSLLKGISGAAALYDDDQDYAYLFGGSIGSRQLACIQVYNPRRDAWCDIKARLRTVRSEFSAVKYDRKAFLIGGCNLDVMEIFDLDTGTIDLWHGNDDLKELGESAALWVHALVALLPNGMLCINIQTGAHVPYSAFFEKKSELRRWKKCAKRAVVLGDLLYLLSPPEWWFYDLPMDDRFALD